MFVKLFVVATILCILQCSVEVDSFEVIKNALKNAAHKVHSFVHPNHVHNGHCKHSHGNEEISISSTTSIPIPAIDIRGGVGRPTSGPQSAPVSGSTTANPEDPDAVPDIGGRTLIGVGCPAGTREANGHCRAIAG